MSKFIFEGARVTLIKFIETLSTVQKWYERNSENISKYLLLFADLGIWYSAIDKLAENQIIFTDDLGLDFAKEICGSTNINEVVQEYYFDNKQQNMTLLIS